MLKRFKDWMYEETDVIAELLNVLEQTSRHAPVEPSLIAEQALTYNKARQLLVDTGEYRCTVDDSGDESWYRAGK